MDVQGMHWHGYSGFTNPDIFVITPFAPPDFEALSTIGTRALFYKAELLQLNRTQFPSLGIFVNKKVGNQKN